MSPDDLAPPVLHAPGLVLRPLQAEHADAMHPLLAEPALYAHLDDDPPPSLAHTRDVYRRRAIGRSPDGAERWLNWLLERPDGRFAGFVQATVTGERAWVAWLVGVPFQRQGLASAAAGAMIDWLVGEAGVRELLASVEADNTPSIALLRRLGFALADAGAHAAHGLGPSERLYCRLPAGAPVPAERFLFADSELAAVRIEPDGRWCLRFAAAAAERTTAEGRAEAGWVRGVSLHAWPQRGAVPGVDPGVLFGRVRAGRVLLADARWASALPLPLAEVPAQRIELTMAQGAELVLPLAALAIGAGGGFETSLAC